MRRELLAGCVVGLCLCAVEGKCQAGSTPVPLQAELVKQLEAKHLASGATIRAKVTVDWSGLACELRHGATLEGTVEAVQARHDTTPSTVAVRFNRAQCNGKELTSISMVVVALAQAPEQVDVVPGVSFGPAAGPYDAPGSGAGGPISDMNTPRQQVATGGHHFPAKTPVSTGDVIDIKGLKLQAGTGPNRSSVLTAEKGDIVLRQYTQMLLVPESLMFAPKPDSAEPAPAATTPSAPPAAQGPSR